MFSYLSRDACRPINLCARSVRWMVRVCSRTCRLGKLYSDVGQPSISRRLPGAAITDFYSVRSKRLLMERLDYNLLFGWFVG